MVQSSMIVTAVPVWMEEPVLVASITTHAHVLHHSLGASVKVRQPNFKLIIETWFVLVKMVISRFVFSILFPFWKSMVTKVTPITQILVVKSNNIHWYSRPNTWRLLTNNVSPQIPYPYQANGFEIVIVTICGSSNKQKQMNVSPTLVRTVGHAWMGFTVSRACVQVCTLAHFAKVRKVAVVYSCILFFEFLY